MTAKNTYMIYACTPTKGLVNILREKDIYLVLFRKTQCLPKQALR